MLKKKNLIVELGESQPRCFRFDTLVFDFQFLITNPSKKTYVVFMFFGGLRISGESVRSDKNG